jgi:zinc finger protein
MSSEIPYFGEHTQITLSCDKCGMRQTDFIPSEERGALSFTLSIEKDEHLQARVVRGSSGTVRIPELDLEVSPGTQSTGYVSNVEGVVNRFIDIIRMMMRQLRTEIDEGNDEASQNLEKLFQLEMALMALVKGELLGDLSLEILDPKGHSIIGHDDAVKKELSAEEVAQLDPGPAPIIMSSEDVE